uniref:EF-hand domain-containing protein n=1 Tax=Ciona savignyi TaxID=51511 RepID=H2YXV4_CIOSA
KIFDHCDEDKKGFLNREDLKVAMLILFGYKPSKYEIQELLGNEKGMKFETFQSIVSSSKIDQDHEIRDMFHMFDTRCRGFLGYEDVKRAFKIAASRIPEATVRACCEELSKESDGRIGYREFDAAMRHSDDSV